MAGRRGRARGVWSALPSTARVRGDGVGYARNELSIHGDMLATASDSPVCGCPYGASEVTAVDGSAGAFEVSAQYAEARVVLVVRGELDRVTAPELGAVIDAVIDRGNVVVVLDLAECDFIDASGLRVIADGAFRAGLWGGKLSVRSPSGVVGRLLDLTGQGDLAASVSSGLLGPVADRLVPRQPFTRSATVAGAGLGGLVPSWRQPGAIPAADDTVDGVLRLVVTLACAAVGGADGVSVSLRRHDRLATVAASDGTVSAMDADQYATGEGPCVDASMQGRWFHTPSLEAEARWPAFTPRARALGINAILSSPLLAGDRPVGALNIYSRTTAAFAPEDQEMASVFAAEASKVVTAAAEAMTADEVDGRLGAVLRTRQVIALAQGVMMERLSIGENDAYTALRRFSAMTGRPLRERAEDMVASTQSPIPELTTEPTGPSRG
jgi:anti-anti-sigma factor